MIPQIYIMAVITLVFSLALWGGLIYLFAGRTRRFFWLLVLGLPLSAIANLYIKQQVTIFIGQAAHIQPGLGLAAPLWFLAFKVLITPLVEELLKVSPLLLRPAWRMVVSRASALWVGLVLGVSFGMGEAAFISYAVAQNPDYASIPWYGFTGFMNERLMTCFAHAVMTAVLVTALQRRNRQLALLGYLAAVSLHLFLNMPVVLYQFQLISIELESFSMVLPLISFAIIFEKMRRTARGLGEYEDEKEIVYLQR